MPHNRTRFDRRTVLTALASAPLVAACSSGAEAEGRGPDFAGLERRYGARLGVFAVNARTGRSVRNRADERFPLCSTAKGYAVGALLQRHPLRTGFFDRLVRFAREELVTHSPITEQHVDTGMTIFDLSAGALDHSDNTAMNLLLREIGGPSGIAPFARSIGDPVTRLDRWEPELNTAFPGDVRDTTTPRAIAGGYRAMVLGDALGAPEREQLKRWMLANTTGDQHIRAGLPADWVTADKTGGGDYGTVNDVAITWPPQGDPIVLSVLSTKFTPDATADKTLIADAARLVAEALG